jgi:hypothetical protein
MGYRRFIDGQGCEWEAWEVHPSAVERRLNAERRAQPRGSPDRRQKREFRLVMPMDLQSGWLAFQRDARKVRLAPIPPGWMHLSDEELSLLLQRATRRGRPFYAV